MQAFNPATYYNGQMPILNLNQYHSNLPHPSFRFQSDYVAPEYVKEAILKNPNRMPLLMTRGSYIVLIPQRPIPPPRHSFLVADPIQLSSAPTSTVTAQENIYTYVFNGTTYFSLPSHPPPADICFPQYYRITPEYQTPTKGAKRRPRAVAVEEDGPNTPSPTPCFSRAEAEKESAVYHPALGDTVSLLLCVNAKLKVLYPNLAVDTPSPRPSKSSVAEEKFTPSGNRRRLQCLLFSQVPRHGQFRQRR
jgi:hypothetical protein